MAIYVTSFDVRGGSADRIFDYVADFSNAASWDPGVPHASKIGDDEPRLGTEFDIGVSVLGTATTFRYEITRFDRPNIVEFQAQTRWMKSRDEISFLPLSDGVHVTYIARLELSPLLLAADPALQFAFDAIGDRARDGLKNALQQLAKAFATEPVAKIAS
jgi:hypothetical protein